MNKANQKGSQGRMNIPKPRCSNAPFIVTLQQELYKITTDEDTMPGMKPNKSIIIKQKDDMNEALSLGDKGNEETKFDEQFSQSSISGKPSPFMNNEPEIPLLRQDFRKAAIRNKSWDNFCTGTVLLESRYRNSLKHCKIQCDYE